MSSRRLHRRQFVRAAGGTLLALPLLQSLRGAKAAPGEFPPRLVLMYNPNGTIAESWFPTNVQSESEFELNAIHAPLAPYKDRLLIFNGIDAKVTELGPGGPHQRGIGALFTGRELQEGEFRDGCGSLAGWANGISVDQRVANAIGTDTPFKSLELGVRALETDVQARISYAGPGQPLPPMNEPLAVYDRLFGSFASQPVDPDDPSDQRRSVLDAVKQQFSVLQSKVGQDDREKLEQHVGMVRDIERRLGIGVGECELPLEPGPLDPNDESHMPEIMRTHLDLLAVAFACDLTRVASLQISTGFNRIRFPWLDSLGEGHSLSHTGESNTEARAELVKRATWHAEQLAYLMDRLASIPEGDGSVLDNTLIVWGNEVSAGNAHSLTNIPYLMAGNVNGYFRTGRYLEFGGVANNDLLTAIIQAYGIDEASFGHPDYATGPLSGLT